MQLENGVKTMGFLQGQKTINKQYSPSWLWHLPSKQKKDEFEPRVLLHMQM